jgi:LEA14-like dessication related protein
MKLFFILFFFIFNSCVVLQNFISGGKEPRFSLKSVKIDKIDLETLSLKLLTDVNNPYPVNLPKSLVDLDIRLEGTNLTKIKNDLGNIEANSTKEMPIDLKIKYSDIASLVKKFPNKELLDLNLKGNMSLPLPESLSMLGKKNIDFPVDFTKSIPSIQPSIDIKNFKVTGLEGDLKDTAGKIVSGVMSGNLKGVDPPINTEFDIAISNLAGAKLNLEDLKYNLNLNGEKFLSGEPIGILNNGKESILKIKSSIPLQSASTGLRSALKSKNPPFQLTGLSKLKIDGLPDGLLDFDFDKKGTIK